MASITFKLCNLVRMYTLISGRYPTFKRDLIDSKINKPSTPSAELEVYEEHCVDRHRVATLVVFLIYLAYGLKSTYISVELTRLFNYNQLELNIVPVTLTASRRLKYPLPADNLKTFACIVTNCSQLTWRLDADETPKPRTSIASIFGPRPLAADVRLAEEASRLPLFQWCHPILNLVYPPTSNLDTFGVFSFFVSGFTVFMLGAFTILYSLYKPSSLKLILFIPAPRVTRRLLRDRAKEFVCDLAMSYHNYRLFSRRVSSFGSLTGCDVLARQSTIRKRDSVFNYEPLASRPSILSKLSMVSITGANIKNNRYGAATRPSLAPHSPTATTQAHGKGSHADSESELSDDKLVESIARNLLYQNKSPDKIRAWIDLCMPLVRSDWWRPHLQRILYYTSHIMVLYVFCAGLFAFGYVEYMRRAKIQLFKEYASVTKAFNCYLWTNEARTLHPSEALRFDQISMTWSWFSIMETVNINYAAGFASALLLAYYWAMLIELSFWLAELHTFLFASLLVVRLHNRLHQRHLEGPNSTAAADPFSHLETRHFFTIANLRRHLRDSIYITWPPSVMCRFPRYTREQHSSVAPITYDYALMHSRSAEQYHEANFLAELLLHSSTANWSQASDKRLLKPPSEVAQPLHGRKLSLEDEIETLEQIYVNFRLFVDYVHSLPADISLILALVYLLNYGYVLMAAICRSKLATIGNQPAFLMFFAWSLSNLFVAVGANFNANAKRLQPIIWSLLAQLVHTEDTRVRHLHDLWLKQLQAIDGEGGLAIRAMGMRITYVAVIKVSNHELHHHHAISAGYRR